MNLGYQNSFGAAPPRFNHPMPPRMPPQMGPNSFVNAPVYPPNDPRMMVPNRMGPNPQRSLSFPTNMRPVRPGMYGPPFMDSPTTPTFPPQVNNLYKSKFKCFLQGMMQNGVPMNGPGIPPQLMPGMPPNNPNNYDPQMMMNPQVF